MCNIHKSHKDQPHIEIDKTRQKGNSSAAVRMAVYLKDKRHTTNRIIES